MEFLAVSDTLQRLLGQCLPILQSKSICGRGSLNTQSPHLFYWSRGTLPTLPQGGQSLHCHFSMGTKKKLRNGSTGSSSIFPHPDDYRTSEQGWNIPAEKSRLLIGFNSLQNHWFYIPEIPEKSFIKLLKLKETISEAGLLTSYWQDTVYLSIYIIRIFL